MQTLSANKEGDKVTNRNHRSVSTKLSIFVFTQSISSTISNMATALSFRNESSNSLANNSDRSPLSWESFLPNHAIFKAFEKRAKLPRGEVYLDKNVLAEMHGDLFLWDDEWKQIYVANLKNLKAKNERSSKLQVVLKC